jgi:protein-tyrosine kinase
MGLIESATRRLDTLARAGIVVPGVVRKGAAQAGLIADNGSLVTSAGAMAWEPIQRVALDIQALGQMGYVTPNIGRSQLADEFRRPKRVLLHNAHHPTQSLGSRAALVMVTSAVPGEGKTFCALNLALSMAMEMHTEVLLVDADTVRPSVMGRLGLNDRTEGKGLTDLLSDPTLELHDVALATNIPRFSVLPPGCAHHQAHELYASERMKRVFLDWVRQGEHRVVVMDSPACLVSSEAQALSALAGQIVMVVRAEDTPSALVHQAFETVKDSSFVYAILNQCTEQPTAQRYGDAYAPPVPSVPAVAAAPSASAAKQVLEQVDV